MPFLKVPFGDTKAFNVVVEVPAGTQKKYEYDASMDAIKLEKVLYGDLKFPLNYGHIPKTIADDEDFLDAFVLSTYPISTGTVVECRPVGLLEVYDRGHKDFKVVCVPLHESAFEHVQDIGDLPKDKLSELEDFYKKLPEAWSRNIELRGIGNRDAAVKELLRTSNS